MRIGVNVALAVSLLAATAGGSAAGRALPRDVRQLLNQKFPGWHFATIIDSLKAEISPDSSPEWVEGDYDGDGQTDYAVQIVRPGPRDSQQVVLAFLHRGKGYELRTLKSFGIQQASFLRTSPKGQETMDIDNGTKIINPSDAIDLLYGQEAGETFIYEKGQFRLIASGG
jgi:hypothetical protein